MERDRTITTVVFDLGRVLVTIDPASATERLSVHLGIAERRLSTLLREVERPFETGVLSTDAFLARLLSERDGHATRPGASGRDGTPDDEEGRRFITETLASRFGLMDGMPALVRRIAGRGYVLGLASNTSPLDMASIDARFPEAIAPFAGRRFLSYEIGAMKPERAFYAALLGGLGMEGSRVLFIDDLAVNVQAARAAGMHALVFDGAAGLEARLVERGILSL